MHTDILTVQDSGVQVATLSNDNAGAPLLITQWAGAHQNESEKIAVAAWIFLRAQQRFKQPLRKRVQRFQTPLYTRNWQSRFATRIVSPACYLRPRSCHDLADSALAFRSGHRLWCLKNTLPRIVLPQRSQVLTTNACLRKACNPPASSLPALGARSMEPASQSRVSLSRKSVLISAPYRAQNFVRDLSVTRGS